MPARTATLLDSFGGHVGEAARLRAGLAAAGATAERELGAHRAKVAAAAREADYLRASAAELAQARSAARRGDRPCRAAHRHDARREDRLRRSRTREEVLSGQNSPLPPLASLLRRLQRKAADVPGLLDDVIKSLDEALISLDAAQSGVEVGAAGDRIRSAASWRRPRSGCLRCAPRRASMPCRSTISRGCATRWWPISPISTPARSGWRASRSRRRPLAAPTTRSPPISRALREAAARALETAVMKELPALKLERAEFIVELSSDADEPRRGRHRPRSSSGCAPIPARGPGR